MDVPDQELNPPEHCGYVTWDEYVEHEQDRLIDEAKERENDNNLHNSQNRRTIQKRIKCDTTNAHADGRHGRT